MQNNKRNLKQIVALTGVILIAVMIIATLITAFTDSSGVYFRSCLIVTIALPIALWVFIWAYGAMMNRHTIASMDILKEAEETEDACEKGKNEKDN